MYRDLLLDQIGVNFLGAAPLDLELLHTFTSFHWNALGSTLGWWFCHNNTVSCNEKFWVEQVTPPPPGGRTRGGEGQGGGVHPKFAPRPHHGKSALSWSRNFALQGGVSAARSSTSNECKHSRCRANGCNNKAPVDTWAGIRMHGCADRGGASTMSHGFLEGVVTQSHKWGCACPGT